MSSHLIVHVQITKYLIRVAIINGHNELKLHFTIIQFSFRGLPLLHYYNDTLNGHDKHIKDLECKC